MIKYRAGVKIVKNTTTKISRFLPVLRLLVGGGGVDVGNIAFSFTDMVNEKEED